ncbi:hypothetical protein DMENIID0001_000040 [Sergentomyia squamirostris]
MYNTRSKKRHQDPIPPQLKAVKRRRAGEEPGPSEQGQSACRQQRQGPISTSVKSSEKGRRAGEEPGPSEQRQSACRQQRQDPIPPQLKAVKRRRAGEEPGPSERGQSACRQQ